MALNVYVVLMEYRMAKRIASASPGVTAGRRTSVMKVSHEGSWGRGGSPAQSVPDCEAAVLGVHRGFPQPLYPQVVEVIFKCSQYL